MSWPIPLFAIYWTFLGYPLSCLKGSLVDKAPFSMVELGIWLGLASTLFWLALWLIFRKQKQHPLKSIRNFCFYCGPLFLFILSLGQGAFPLCMAPTAWRAPLAKVLKGKPLVYDRFLAQKNQHEKHLNENFSPSFYESLSEEEMLFRCNNALDSLLLKLDLMPGRKVKRIKTMGPFTTTLGLAYGGPAFHDPFFGEIAMVSNAQHPEPHYWRLIGICHEMTHAKGFTREMDAEILTQLALTLSQDTRLNLLGDIMYLRKTGEAVDIPGYLSQELKLTRQHLQQVESQQRTVLFLRKMGEKFKLQNSGGKYGYRKHGETWNDSHPFFSIVESVMQSHPDLVLP